MGERERGKGARKGIWGGKIRQEERKGKSKEGKGLRNPKFGEKRDFSHPAEGRSWWSLGSCIQAFLLLLLASPRMHHHPALLPSQSKAASAQTACPLGNTLSVLCPALFLCFWFSSLPRGELTCALEELFRALDGCLEGQTVVASPAQADLSQDGLEPLRCPEFPGARQAPGSGWASCLLPQPWGILLPFWVPG